MPAHERGKGSLRVSLRQALENQPYFHVFWKAGRLLHPSFQLREAVDIAATTRTRPLQERERQIDRSAGVKSTSPSFSSCGGWDLIWSRRRFLGEQRPFLLRGPLVELRLNRTEFVEFDEYIDDMDTLDTLIGGYRWLLVGACSVVNLCRASSGATLTLRFTQSTVHLARPEKNRERPNAERSPVERACLPLWKKTIHSALQPSSSARRTKFSPSNGSHSAPITGRTLWVT